MINSHFFFKSAVFYLKNVPFFVMLCLLINGLARAGDCPATGSVTVSCSVPLNATDYDLSIDANNVTVTNNGTIENSSQIFAINVNSGITGIGVTNANSIRANGLMSFGAFYGYGIRNNGAIDTLTNGGLIATTDSNNSNVSAYAYGISNAWTIYAIINNDSITASTENNSYSLGSFNAYGISNSTVGIISALTNNGAISALVGSNSSALGSSSAYGIQNAGRLLALTNNSGIQASASLNTTAGVYSSGIYSSEFIDTLKNNGSIIAISSANTITNFSNITAYGIHNHDTINILTNDNLIAASTSNNTGRTNVYGIYSSLNSTISTLTNNSSITATTSGNTGSSAESNGIKNFGTIDNLTNTGSITARTLNNTGIGYAYGIYNGGRITTLTNTGSITARVSTVTGSIQDVYEINNPGIIVTLNNLQGASSTALIYANNLPTNYNIIVRSSTSYGQLAVTNGSGSTTFGIYSGGVSGVTESTLAKGTYRSVLSGITTSNLTGATSGNYNGFTWALSNSSGTIWDLIVTGASTVDTQQSLVNTASALRNVYALQNTVLVNGFSYDCPVFDKNDICLSTGGRYSTTNVNSVSTTSALLIGAYRLSKQIRLGAYVDQNLSSSGNMVNLNNSKPMIGLFGIWNEREDGVGAEVKVSAGFGKKDTTITRQVVGTSEAGSGSSALNTKGTQITAKYNMAAMDKTIVSPYVGIRYTQNRMNSYVEATNSNVTAPLTYTALNTDATTAIAGVGVKYQLDSKMTLLASAGVESDLSNNHGTYSATGITGLTAISFNANPAKTRATFSAGAHYDIDKRQRISLTGIYREEAYRSVNTMALFATYRVGL